MNLNLTPHQWKVTSELYSAYSPKGERETEEDHVRRVGDALAKLLHGKKMIEPGNSISQAGLECLKELLGPERMFRFWIEIEKEN
jgi:hypothetical protein